MISTWYRCLKYFIPAFPFCSVYRKLKSDYVCKHDYSWPMRAQFYLIWPPLLTNKSLHTAYNQTLYLPNFKVCTWEYIYPDRSGWPPAAARYWDTAGIRNGRYDWLSARSWCWLAGRGGSGESARPARTSRPPRGAAAGKKQEFTDKHTHNQEEKKSANFYKKVNTC